MTSSFLKLGCDGSVKWKRMVRIVFFCIEWCSTWQMCTYLGGESQFEGEVSVKGREGMGLKHQSSRRQRQAKFHFRWRRVPPALKRWLGGRGPCGQE